MNELGVSFAPTPDNAAMGSRNGQLSGVPRAVQVLSLALPRVVGAKPIAPTDLLTGAGGGGMDPLASAILQTIMRTLGNIPGQPGSLPGGTAGPNPPMGGPQGPQGPFPRPPADPMPQPPGPFNPKPRVVPQDDPQAPTGGGGWTPGAGPYTAKPIGRGRFGA